MLELIDYFNYLELENYYSLFDDSSKDKINKLKLELGVEKSNEIIYEYLLNNDKQEFDFSLKLDIQDNDFLTNCWYEYDFDCIENNLDKFGYFIDALKVLTDINFDNNEYFFNNLPLLIDEKTKIDEIRSNLIKVLNALNGKCRNIFQLGVMKGRGQIDSIRIFTKELKTNDLLDFLKELKWNGDFKFLENNLNIFSNFSDNKKFLLDFDVYPDKISNKIGINFGIPKNVEKTDEFLTYLVEENLCTEGKKNDILKWIQRPPSHSPFIQNDISHFKIPFENNKILSAKIYLRQGTVPYTPYTIYDTPVLMNFELTTRCPLKCPQCYCDLTRGKDLNYDIAIHWINEASKNNVKVVNLSGGETLVYKNLIPLIEYCTKLNIETNVALSGYNFNKKKLNQFVEAGLTGICISLNGSTEEINSYSRDGYNLAIDALEILKTCDSIKTSINWVMHSNNADDFENMVILAESYEVDEVVVMVFKPDSNNQIKSLPTYQQMLNVSKIIKQKDKKVKIIVEECFSQMKALINQTFFINKNVGVQKGCGALRDGISINVDGKISPCRHLELIEEFTSIKDYWQNSKFAYTIRNIEKDKKEPCNNCKFKDNCLPCIAVNYKLNNKIYMGDTTCPIGKEI